MNKLPSFIPGQVDGRHWVYLIGWGNGDLKVGRTTNPRGRMSSHGVPGLAWCHLCGYSDTGVVARETERLVIKILGWLGRRHGRTEVFSGVEKGLAIRTVRCVMDFQRADWADWFRQATEAEAAEVAWEAFRAQYVPTEV